MPTGNKLERLCSFVGDMQQAASISLMVCLGRGEADPSGHRQPQLFACSVGAAGWALGQPGLGPGQACPHLACRGFCNSFCLTLCRGKGEADPG